MEAGDPGRFHALFGRDSLIFALQVLPTLPDVAVSTLRALAAVQGTIDDAEIDEQPGRIIHEYRPVAPDWLIERGWPTRDGAIKYYGTTDATSWFLVLLAAVKDPSLNDELRGNWQAAATWLESALTTGGGLIRCGPRLFPGGLAQQGWRDALDPSTDEDGGGIAREDGGTPTPPLADADSQAVAVAALDALASIDFARKLHWQKTAADLRHRLSRLFGPNVMAIDGNDRPISGAGSQLGWLLWADAIDDAAKDALTARLVSPALLTDFGVRTLSSDHPAFRFDGYHRGAIWPFDNWIAWGGLRSVAEMQAASTVRNGVKRALEHLGRYPELYFITTAGALRPAPVANRVQAWTVGAALAFEMDWDGRPSLG